MQISSSKTLGQLIYHKELKGLFFFLFLKCKLSLPKEKEKRKGLLLPLIFVFFWTKILAPGTMSPMWFIWILLGVRRPGYVSLCFLYLLFCQIPSQVFFGALYIESHSGVLSLNSYHSLLLQQENVSCPVWKLLAFKFISWTPIGMDLLNLFAVGCSS